MYLSPRHWMFMGVLLAVPICSWFMVFRPQNREISLAKTEIQLKEKMLEKLRAATAQTADLAKANEEIQQAISAIEARLPSNKEIDNVLREVAQITARHGLRVPQFKKSARNQATGSANEQPLEVELTGDFDGFYRFLLDLEKIPRITRLTDAKIQRDSKNDGQMTATFTLSIYYQGDSPKDVADAAGGNDQ